MPFSNPKELCRQYVYLHNCQRFLDAHPALHAWFNSSVTSAFLVPWRTRNASELYRLNQQSKGLVFAYARVLVSQILNDHHAQLLITAGKSSLTLLNDLAVFETPLCPGQYFGPGGSYQWSQTEALWRGSKITILQIPHFSRANSPDVLRQFGVWLAGALERFPANQETASQTTWPSSPNNTGSGLA